MFICSPQLVGKYPDWVTFELKFLCFNFTPEDVADIPCRKEWGFAYNRGKPFVDISIGIGAVVTTLGVPGKNAFDRDD